MDRMRHYHVFETAAGFCAVAWNDVGITNLRLPVGDDEQAVRGLLRRAPAAVPAAPPPVVAAAIAAVQRYFAGAATDFSGVAVDLGPQDAFFEQVYAAVRRLPWGDTTTYGALAKALGAGPEAARDVGQAMATNPVPLIIPCHRVLAAGGKVGGFSAPGGAATKLKMLALEGVDLSPPPPAQQSLGL